MKTTCVRIGVFGLGTLLALVGGCAQESRSDVPSNAVQMSSGGKVVAFTASRDGKAYLHDDTDNRVVYSTDLKENQVMRFDPITASVRIDGNSAPEGIANPSHDHSIYFAASPQTARTDAPANASNNVMTDNSGRVPTIRVPIGVQVDVQTQPSTPK